MKPSSLLAIATTLASCGLARGPGIGLMPAFDVAFEDRVWREVEADASAGPVRVFLSDGAMLTASCAGGYRLNPWRRVDDTTLVWEDGAAVVRAEIAAVGPREFALVVDPEGAARPLTLERAEAPAACD